MEENTGFRADAPYNETVDDDDAIGVNSKLLSRARLQFEEAKDFWTPHYERAAEDKKFIAGDQWLESLVKERELVGKPTITAPLLRRLIDRIIGAMLKSSHNMDVFGVDPVPEGPSVADSIFTGGRTNTDYNKAQLYEGLLRFAEYCGRSHTHYEAQRREQLMGGVGWLRMYIDFHSPSSFKRDLKFEGIKFTNTIFVHPGAKQPDYSDARYAFELVEMPWREFKAKYPSQIKQLAFGSDQSNIDPVLTFNDLRNSLDTLVDGRPVKWEHWFRDQGERITIAHWYERRAVEETFYLTSEGQEFDSAGWEEHRKNFKENNGVEAPDALEQKTAQTWRVDHRVITGFIQLEATQEFVIDEIPFVPVLGRQIINGDDTRYESVIRHGKGLQQLANWALSHYVETISDNTKSKVLIPRGSMSEQDKKDFSDKNKTLTEYDPNPNNDYQQPLSPTILNNKDPGTAELQLTDSVLRLLEKQIGVIDPLQGAGGTANSGVQEGLQIENIEIGYIEYDANFNVALEALYRKGIKAIPHIYNNTTAIRVITIDDVLDEIDLGEEIFKSDLGIGRYDIRVSAGPSSITQRLMLQNVLTSLLQSGDPLLARGLAPSLLQTLDVLNNNRLMMQLARSFAAGGALQILPPEFQRKILEEQKNTGQLQETVNQLAEQLAQTRLQELLQSGNVQATLATQQAKAVEAQSRESRANTQATADAVKQQFRVQQEAFQTQQDRLQVLQEAMQTEQEFNRLKQQQVQLATALAQAQSKGLELSTDQKQLVQQILTDQTAARGNNFSVN